jgi:hypothetical protein
MSHICLALMWGGLGMFLALFLVAWEINTMAATVRTPLRVRGYARLSSNYPERVDNGSTVVATVCSYCQVVTPSLWCGQCTVYYCGAHNAAAHRDCGLPAQLALPAGMNRMETAGD